MSFPDAVRTCLQQKYADFSGRARRSEFWFFTLFTIIVGIVVSAIDRAVDTPTVGGFGLIALVVQLALLAPSLAVGARRLHDTGRSEKLLAIGYVPYVLGIILAAAGVAALGGLLVLAAGVGFIVLIVFWAQDSKPDNQYGPNPKGVGAGQAYQQAPPQY